MNDDRSELVIRVQSMALVRWLATECASDTLYPKSNLYEIKEAIGVLDDMMNSWQPCFSVAMPPQMYGYPEGHQQTDKGKKLIQELHKSGFKRKCQSI